MLDIAEQDQGIRFVSKDIAVKVDLPSDDQLDLLKKAQSLCKCIKEGNRTLKTCVSHHMLAEFGPSLLREHHMAGQLETQEFNLNNRESLLD